MKISLNLKNKIHQASLKAESWKIKKNMNKKSIVIMFKINSMSIKI